MSVTFVALSACRDVKDIPVSAKADAGPPPASASAAPSAVPSPPASAPAIPPVTLPSAARLVEPFRGTRARGFVAISGAGGARAIVPIVSGDAIDPDQPVLIASFTKLFTAVAALRMAARGELTFDRTIKDAIPALASRPWAGSTLRELLTHTSLIPEFSESSGYYRLRDVDMTDPVAAIAKFVPSDWAEKRGVYKYRNSELAVVGAILALRAGLTEEEVLSREVFVPAKMKHAGLVGANRPRDVDVSPMGAIRVENFFTAGAGYASASDLLGFFDALDGPDLLDEKSKKLLYEGDAERGHASLGCWAYPFARADGGTTRLLERPGSLGDVRLFTAFFPDEHRAIVAWTPSGIELPRPRARPRGIGASLARVALE